MATLQTKCTHEFGCCNWRLRQQLFGFVIRLHLILFGQKGQTLKRGDVCECVRANQHDWITCYLMFYQQ